ncbi:hypothetical protein F7725_026346, partial [Dissostichus mawsoni]
MRSSNGWLFQQGDTNVPAMPSNVLEMMRNHLEQKERAQTLGTCPSPPLKAHWTPRSPVTDSGSHTETDSCSCPPSTSTQSPDGVKAPPQPSTKQRRPRDKKDVSTGQKAASELRKADDQRPSTSTPLGWIYTGYPGTSEGSPLSQRCPPAEQLPEIH